MNSQPRAIGSNGRSEQGASCMERSAATSTSKAKSARNGLDGQAAHRRRGTIRPSGL